MRKLEEMQRRLAEERRRLDDAKRAVETAAPIVVVKERGVGQLPVEPVQVEAVKPVEKVEEEEPVYQVDRRIATMLHGLDLSRYETNFAHNKITYDQLFSLRDRDLRAMGIDAVGPRARILQAINVCTRADMHRHRIHTRATLTYIFRRRICMPTRWARTATQPCAA